jgi:hypothetical protein
LIEEWMKGIVVNTKLSVLVIALLIVCFEGTAAQAAPSPKAFGQNEPDQETDANEYPEMELAVGYSFLRACPKVSFFNAFFMNGGGGAFVYNAKSWLGVKAEFMGYTTGGGFKKQLTNLGAAGASANLFTGGGAAFRDCTVREFLDRIVSSG